MGVSLAEIRTRCNSILKFSRLAEFTQAERDDAIYSAVRRYSRERPFTEVEAYTSTGADFYTVPTGWEEGFSSIIEIEYPIERTPKETMDERYYGVIKNPTGYRLRFDCSSPTTGDAFWVRYTKRYTFDSDGNSDIPEQDEDGVVFLALYGMCNILSNYFAAKANPSLPEAEIVGFTTRVDEWARRAEEYEKQYEKVIFKFQSGTWGHIDFSENMMWDRNRD